MNNSDLPRVPKPCPVVPSSGRGEHRRKGAGDPGKLILPPINNGQSCDTNSVISLAYAHAAETTRLAKIGGVIEKDHI